MGCNCGKKKDNACGMTPEVVEIINEECPVLFHKTTISVDRGDDSPESPVAPENGRYKNTLVEYEANGHAYLYSSDGIFTRINAIENNFNKLINRPKYAGEVMTGDTDIPSVEDETAARISGDEALAEAISQEASERRDADSALQDAINTKQNRLTPGENITIENDTISAKDTTYSSGTGISITGTVISVDNTIATKDDLPTKTSDLTNDGADGTSVYVEAKDMPVVDSSFSDSSENAVQNKIITSALDRAVMTDLTLGPNPSTTVVQLDATKTNLRSGSSTVSSVPLPVASSTQAGVMNSATFDAVSQNTNNINALLNGAVAIPGLPANPTQAELTTAWKTATGLSTLINRASIYDSTNNRVWTYYTNDTTWHGVSASGGSVTVNQFTNTSLGTIKGSTNTGQVFAENDGTGSVNGWDTLSGTVADHTSKLATIAQGAEVNVQSNWAESDSSSDAFILNKPQNLVQDANYVHTDNNFTTAEKNKLDDVYGEDETYTIAVSGWSTVTGADPFKFSSTVTATHVIGANTIVELINDQAVLFANYGFSIASVSGQSITLYALSAPDSSVTLKINFKEAT